MTWFLCAIWPYLCGGLLGWLAAGWLARCAMKRAETTHQARLAAVSTAPKVVEKRVEVPVEKTVEKIVEKVVEKAVDNPAHVAQIASLSAALATAQSAAAKVAATGTTTTGATGTTSSTTQAQGLLASGATSDAQHQEIADWRMRYEQLERSHQKLLNGPDIDMGAAKAAGFNLKSADQLEIIEGIGPKIADLLRAAGTQRFYQLAQMTPAQIQVILDAAGSSFKLAKPETWPEQAGLAAHNQWRALKALQDALDGGVRE